MKIGDLHCPEGPAGALDELLFDAPVGAHEEDLAAGLPLPDEPGQGQGGVHMARRAAAGEYDLHTIPRLNMQFCCCAGILENCKGRYQKHRLPINRKDSILNKRKYVQSLFRIG